MPPPVPPSVKEGRMTAGNPTIASASFAAPCEFIRQPHDGVVAAVVEEISLLIFLVAQLAFQRDAARHFKADLQHGAAEQFAVFRLVDCIGGGADQFDIVFFERAALAQRERGVERRLSAHRGQQREHAAFGHIRLFARDDLFDEIRRDGFDIGRIRHVRVGHDRGGIGIDQNHPIALGPERLARLRAGIIEFAGLTDDDGACADDEDRVDVCAFWHRVSRADGHTRNPRVGP